MKKLNVFTLPNSVHNFSLHCPKEASKFPSLCIILVLKFKSQYLNNDYMLHRFSLSFFLCCLNSSNQRILLSIDVGLKYDMNLDIFVHMSCFELSFKT